MFSWLKSSLRRGFPDYTRRGRLFRRVAVKLGLLRDPSWSRTYYDWVRLVEPGLFAPPLQAAGEAPLFSVVVPFFNTPARYAQPLLDSISSQSFQGWELIMADASTDEEASQRLKSYASRDPRFVYVKLEDNAGIASNTNQAISHARGTYVAFADHDDVVSPYALNEMAAVILDDKDVDILYSDEDVLSEDGLLRKGPFFKPAWSPHMFLEMNYTNHLSVIRRDLLDEVGGLRPDLDGAQDYDLLLRIHALGRPIKVRHIPGILYHWREAEHSTARDISTKRYAIDAGRRGLDDYMHAMGVEHEETSDVDGRPGWYRIRPRQACTVLVLVCASADPCLNDKLARELEARTQGHWAKPVVESVPPPADLRAYASTRTEDVVVIQRCGCLPEEPTWLDDLSGVLALPQTAAVAPLVVDEQGAVVNAGLVNEGGRLAPLYPGCPVAGGGMAGPADLVRDADGLSTHVIAFPRSTACDALWLPADIDGTDCDGRLVVWGHTKVTRRPLAHADGILNPRLSLAGPDVVLTGPEETPWKR